VEYTIWCDESDKKGKRFSNFYGGAIVSSVHMEEVLTRLEFTKTELNLFGEAKWQKVSTAYLDKYKKLIDEFFALMNEGKIKTRIMFTDNNIIPVGLTREQINKEFFLLYYQFIKHAFGFMRAPYHDPRATLHLNFDKLPDKTEKVIEFKKFIYGLNRELVEKNIIIPNANISEIDSHTHVVLQCVDIITGSMSFRLNDKHKIIPPGKHIRGKKTRAKEKLYKYIYNNIKILYGGFQFSPGISTGWHDGQSSSWTMPYRHWRFTPRERVLAYKSRKPR
jgi:hypothetical protein